MTTAFLSNELTRTGTYIGWPEPDHEPWGDVKPSVADLVKAGFFYTGNEDIVRCFACGLQIQVREQHLDPHIVHASRNPSCPFVMGNSNGSRQNYLPSPVENDAASTISKIGTPRHSDAPSSITLYSCMPFLRKSGRTSSAKTTVRHDSSTTDHSSDIPQSNELPPIGRNIFAASTEDTTQRSFTATSDTPNPRRRSVSDPQHLTNSHIQRASPDNLTNSHIQRASPDNLTNSHIQRASPDNLTNSHIQRARPDNLTNSHIQRASPDNLTNSHIQIARPDNLTNSHIQRASPDNLTNSHIQRASPDNLTNSHIQRASPDNLTNSHIQRARQDNLTNSHIQRARPDNLTNSHIQRASPDNLTNSHIQIARPDNLTNSHIQRASPDNLTNSHIQRASPDNLTNSHIQRASPDNLTNSHIQRASPDNLTNSHIQRASPDNLTNSHIQRASPDNLTNSHIQIARPDNLTNSHIQRASPDNLTNSHIQRASPDNLTNSHIQRASPDNLTNSHIQRPRPDITDLPTRKSSVISEKQNFNSDLDLVELRKSAEARLQTFNSWIDITMSRAKEFSHAGFMYIGPDDRVQCVFCGGILRFSVSARPALTTHFKHYPECSFAVESLSAMVTPKPRHCKYRTEPVRLSSFYDWDSSMSPQPAALAKAGFFYTGNGDRVKCFFCNGSLCKWEPNDDPWREHARWFPKCPFVKQSKGQTFISEVSSDKAVIRRHILSLDKTDKKFVAMETNLMLLAQENRRMKTQKQCKVCLDKEVCVTFIPCGHLVCCLTCAPAMQACPICRSKIRKMMRIYMS